MSSPKITDTAQDSTFNSNQRQKMENISKFKIQKSIPFLNYPKNQFDLGNFRQFFQVVFLSFPRKYLKYSLSVGSNVDNFVYFLSSQKAKVASFPVSSFVLALYSRCFYFERLRVAHWNHCAAELTYFLKMISDKILWKMITQILSPLRLFYYTCPFEVLVKNPLHYLVNNRTRSLITQVNFFYMH